MATFTMTLKTVLEVNNVIVGLSDTGQTTVDNAKPIGLSYYPIFDETYRPILNGKIIDRYWNQEIGMETIEMFRFNMRRKMNEIMPLYNKLYLSERLIFDPFVTMNMKTVAGGTTGQIAQSLGASTSNTDTVGKSRAVNSETPQTQLSGNSDYASNASDVNSDNKVASTGNNTGSSTTDVSVNNTNTVIGYSGMPAELLQSYRASLIEIDLMILSQLKEMFMLVWDNGDSYTEGYTL